MFLKHRPALFLLAAATETPAAGGGAETKPIDPAAALAMVTDPKLTLGQRLEVAANALRGIPPTEQFNAVKAELEKAKTDLTAKDAEIARLTAELTARSTDLEAVDKEKAALAKEVADLKAKEQSIEARAEAKTKEKMATLGFPAAALVTPTEQTTALATTYAEALEAYGKITEPKAKAAYYRNTIMPMLDKKA